LALKFKKNGPGLHVSGRWCYVGYFETEALKEGGSYGSIMIIVNTFSSFWKGYIPKKVVIKLEEKVGYTFEGLLTRVLNSVTTEKINFMVLKPG
jgi:hypothetical protein